MPTKGRLKKGFALIFVYFFGGISKKFRKKPKESVFGFDDNISKKVLEQKMVHRK